MKFKVGDRVKVIKNKPYRTPFKRGEVATIEELGTSKESPKIRQNNGDWFYLPIEYFIKEGHMSKYDEIKERIEGVTAWDKEADDILEEINVTYELVIPVDKEYIGASIGIVKRGLGEGEKVRYCESFTFNSQCEKLEAFKKALLWLLDHSDIKKKDNSKEIEKLEKRLYKMNDEYDSIKEEIRKLKS